VLSNTGRAAAGSDNGLREKDADRGYRVTAPHCYSKRLLAVLVQSRGIAVPAAATFVGISAAGVGTWLTAARRRARFVLPLSAGVLLGVALFGLLPELAVEAGWAISLLLFGAGYGGLIAFNRYVYPVCPTCAHDHDHRSCATELHGFAAPLVAAAAVHSFVDGWSVTTAQWTAPLGLRVAVPLAVGLHKIPEGIALGGLLLASMGSRARALSACIIAEGITLVGGGRGCFWRRAWERHGFFIRWGLPQAGSSISDSMRSMRSGSGAGSPRRLCRRSWEWRALP
jgi:zinc transporter ZupT